MKKGLPINKANMGRAMNDGKRERERERKRLVEASCA